MKKFFFIVALQFPLLLGGEAFRLNPAGLFPLPPSSMGMAGQESLFYVSLDALSKTPLALKGKSRAISLYGSGGLLTLPVSGNLETFSWLFPYGGSFAVKLAGDVRVGGAGTFYQMGVSSPMPLRAKEFLFSILIGNDSYFGLSAGPVWYRDTSLDITGRTWRYSFTFGTEKGNSAINFYLEPPAKINWKKHPLAALESFSGLVSLTYEGRHLDRLSALFSVTYVFASRRSISETLTALRYKDEWRFSSAFRLTLTENLSFKTGLSTALLRDYDSTSFSPKFAVSPSFGLTWDSTKKLGFLLNLGYFDTGAFLKKTLDETYSLYGLSLEFDLGTK